MTTPSKESAVLSDFLGSLVRDYELERTQGSILDIDMLNSVHQVPEKLVQILTQNGVQVLRTDARSQGIGRILVHGAQRGSTGLWSPSGVTGPQYPAAESVAVMDYHQTRTMLKLLGEEELPRLVHKKDSMSTEDRVIGSIAQWMLSEGAPT